MCVDAMGPELDKLACYRHADSEYLDSPEMIAEYLTEAFESDDVAFIAKAIGTVARVQGMGAVAESAGVPPGESLPRAQWATPSPNLRPSGRSWVPSACNWWRSRGRRKLLRGQPLPWKQLLQVNQVFD
jgi:probable addiction module antidote protein